ncbi:MAG: S-layer homology domain-containing protein [Bacillota bacterium]
MSKGNELQMLHADRGMTRSILSTVLAVFFATAFSLFLAPAVVFAFGGELTISGPGLNSAEPVTITQEQLQGREPLADGLTYLRQRDVIYSTINTWPTKSWCRGQGVSLVELLEAAGGLKEEATLIKFVARDGFSVTFTVQELLKEARYCFPHFMDTGLPGHLPGDASDPIPVEPIIAHKSFSAQNYGDILNTKNLNDGAAYHLLYGQRSVTEQTNARFVKYVTEIQVLTDPPLKWDKPTASVLPGQVPPGTLVELQSVFNDEDKVHYTLDGSDPTIHSPMYNIISSRWWSSRGREKVAEINRPIELVEDTTIKAVVIGPGRLNSDIVSFSYQVKGPEQELLDIAGHWAEKNIKELVARGVISGYPDGSFRPDAKITRAEFVTMLVKSFRLEGGGDGKFADIANHWAKDYITAAAARKIVGGYADNTFRPDELISREEMAAMLVRAAEMPLASGEPVFADRDEISPWAAGPLVTLAEKGIMKGYPDNTIRPRERASRAEAVQVIIHALHRAAESK